MAFVQWQAGQRILASQLAAMTPKWKDWTPAWTTSSGTATPSFGDATITARYCQSGDLCMVRFEVIFGSTTNFGATPTTSDNWRFSLPVTAASAISVQGFAELNASTGARTIARMRGTTTTDFELEISSGKPDATAVTNAGLVDGLTPWTWASGHAIRTMGFYETA